MPRFAVSGDSNGNYWGLGKNPLYLEGKASIKQKTKPNQTTTLNACQSPVTVVCYMLTLPTHTSLLLVNTCGNNIFFFLYMTFISGSTPFPFHSTALGREKATRFFFLVLPKQ